jgi:hypothetical protein
MQTQKRIQDRIQDRILQRLDSTRTPRETIREIPKGNPRENPTETGFNENSEERLPKGLRVSGSQGLGASGRLKLSGCLRVPQGASGCLTLPQGVSGCLRVAQGVSGCLRVSWSQGLRVLGSQGLRVSGSESQDQSLRVSGSQCVSGCLRVSWSQGLRISEPRGFSGSLRVSILIKSIDFVKDIRKFRKNAWILPRQFKIVENGSKKPLTSLRTFELFKMKRHGVSTRAPLFPVTGGCPTCVARFWP